MNDWESWQSGNEKFLNVALTWLGLQLQQLANSQASNSEEVAKAKTAMVAAQESDPPPALSILSQSLNLSQFETQVLLLCVARELDLTIAQLCAQAQNNSQRPYATFALACGIFDQPEWEAISPQSNLRYWRLLEIQHSATEPLINSPLQADERIVNYLKGINLLDDRLFGLLLPLKAPTELNFLSASQQASVKAIAATWQRSFGKHHNQKVQLLGRDSSSKQQVCSCVCAALGLRLYHLPVELLPQKTAELDNLARLWSRETILLPVALYINAQELSDRDRAIGAINYFLSRSNGFFFLDTRDKDLNLDTEALCFDIAKPTPAEQLQAWTLTLGEEFGETPALLASQFNLTYTQIRKIVNGLELEGKEKNGERGDLIWDACLAVTRPSLENLAQRLDPKATWDNIVLPSEEMELLHQIAAQVRERSRVYDNWGFRARMNRGLGVNALFAGESGTGKTMAAEVIAKDLRLNLYRIDLSAVVSKYIGETEKNLRHLFDAAEDGGAILFFDEADALFGKRSDVKDSHDRFANIEINYLLQRIEAYRGLAILATNMKSALDRAFLRRIRFIVNFPFPSQSERKRLWQKVFPPETPTEGLDYNHLKGLNLTGGSIHNIALNAAFLAAQAEKKVVTMPLILAAARAEYAKLERPINEPDFRWRVGNSQSTTHR